MKRNGFVLLMNPSASASRDHALKVIMDVVRRYDIDGVHPGRLFLTPHPPPAAPGLPPALETGTPSSAGATLTTSCRTCTNPSNLPNPGCGWASAVGIWRPGVPGALKRVWMPTSIWRATPQVAFPRMGGLPGPPALLALQPGQAELSRIDAMVGRPELQTPCVARHRHGTYHEQRRPGRPPLK